MPTRGLRPRSPPQAGAPHPPPAGVLALAPCLCCLMDKMTPTRGHVDKLTLAHMPTLRRSLDHRSPPFGPDALRLPLRLPALFKFSPNTEAGPPPLCRTGAGVPVDAFSGHRGAQPQGVWGLQAPCRGAALSGGRDALGGSMRPPPGGHLKEKRGAHYESHNLGDDKS